MESEPKPETRGSSEKENHVAWRLASGQGDLIYAVTILAFVFAILRSLLVRSRMHPYQRGSNN